MQKASQALHHGEAGNSKLIKILKVMGPTQAADNAPTPYSVDPPLSPPEVLMSSAPLEAITFL